jgi:beta-lactam-binding protein with PASTA domain
MEMRPPAPGESTGVTVDGEWPADTRTLPPAPPPPPPVAPPPAEDPSNRMGLGMLLAIVLLAAAGAALAAVLLTRNDHKQAATPTTVVVTTSAAPTTTAAPKKAKKLILPVPDLIGQQWKDAAAGLRRAGFHVSLATVPSALPRGAVTAQDPKPGAKVAKGSDVRLNVSTGVKHGATTTGAQTTPAAPSATTAAATTTEQATTTTAPTTTQAAQPASAQVPSLSGDLRGALQQLDQAGLAASLAYVPGTQPLGTVVAQAPAGGSTAKTGSQVTVNVSSGPNGNADETVPNVVGQRIPQALGALHATGLRLILLKARVNDRSQAGVIVAQTPTPGKKAPKNAQVLVYMGAYQQ